MDDKNKLKIIFTIDKYSKYLENSIYYKDLQNLRKKYIYKDISANEAITDIKWLWNIKQIITNNKR